MILKVTITLSGDATWVDENDKAHNVSKRQIIETMAEQIQEDITNNISEDFYFEDEDGHEIVLSVEVDEVVVR